MKKVLFVITKSNWGGAQRYVFDLTTSLPRERFDVAVACGGTGAQGAGMGELAERLRAKNIPTLFVRSFARDIYPGADVRAFFELRRLLRDRKPDVVHLNSSKAGGVGALAARLAGVRRIVFTSHGLPFDEDRNAIARALIWLATWATFLLCHTVIAISQDNYERAKRMPLCGKKVRLVHNGIPPLQFEAREKARLSLAVRAGIENDADAIWIGSVGELTRNKGQRYLIEAAALCAKRGKKFVLVLVGGGEDRQKLEELVHAHDIDDMTYFAGFVTEAHRYFKAFEIFALPSVKEGLPYVLLEAGQAGCAVVATKISGAMDIIADNLSGLLAEPKDAKELAEKLGHLIGSASMRSSLSHRLQEKVSAEFSAEHMARETAALY